MKYGFYIIQFENNSIKVEAISFMSNNIYSTNVLKSVFLIGSIGAFLNSHRDIHDEEILATQLLTSVDLSIFSNPERKNIHHILVNMISEYFNFQ